MDPSITRTHQYSEMPSRHQESKHEIAISQRATTAFLVGSKGSEYLQHWDIIEKIGGHSVKLLYVKSFVLIRLLSLNERQSSPNGEWRKHF